MQISISLMDISHLAATRANINSQESSYHSYSHTNQDLLKVISQTVDHLVVVVVVVEAEIPTMITRMAMI